MGFDGKTIRIFEVEGSLKINSRKLIGGQSRRTKKERPFNTIIQYITTP